MSGMRDALREFLGRDADAGIFSLPAEDMDELTGPGGLLEGLGDLGSMLSNTINAMEMATLHEFDGSTVMAPIIAWYSRNCGCGHEHKIPASALYSEKTKALRRALELAVKGADGNPVVIMNRETGNKHIAVVAENGAKIARNQLIASVLADLEAFKAGIPELADKAAETPALFLGEDKGVLERIFQTILIRRLEDVVGTVQRQITTIDQDISRARMEVRANNRELRKATGRRRTELDDANSQIEEHIGSNEQRRAELEGFINMSAVEQLTKLTEDGDLDIPDRGSIERLLNATGSMNQLLVNVDRAIIATTARIRKELAKTDGLDGDPIMYMELPKLLAAAKDAGIVMNQLPSSDGEQKNIEAEPAPATPA